MSEADVLAAIDREMAKLKGSENQQAPQIAEQRYYDPHDERAPIRYWVQSSSGQSDAFHSQIGNILPTNSKDDIKSLIGEILDDGTIVWAQEGRHPDLKVAVDPQGRKRTVGQFDLKYDDERHNVPTITLYTDDRRASDSFVSFLKRAHTSGKLVVWRNANSVQKAKVTPPRLIYAG